MDLYEKYRARDLSPEVFLLGEGTAPASIASDKLARLYAMIENIDENMGRLIDFLAERDLDRDTLLLFLCDNGPQGRRFVGGLRGSKGKVYEGGVRSPLFVRWPGVLEAREVGEDFGAHLDVFPTILDACDVALPEGLELDGRSLLPTLRGESDREPRHPLVIQWNRGDSPLSGQNAFVRHGQWKIVNHANANVLTAPPPWNPELYDLQHDPYEHRDLAPVFPAETDRLSAIYRDWFQDVGADIPEGESWTRYGPIPIRIGGEGAERVVLTRQDWRRTVGKGWGRNGVWRVLFTDGAWGEEGGRAWNVRVIFPAGAQPTQVQMGINSGAWTYFRYDGEVEEGMTEVTLEGVQGAWLPDRPASVDCRLTGGERGEMGPHQLIFYR